MEKKFRQDQIIAAHKVLTNLSNEPLNIKLSYQIYRLLKKLQPYYDFQVEKERELFKKYNPKPSENGTFDFNTPEEAQEFANAMKELWESEIDDLDFKPVVLHLDQDNIQLSVKDIKALDDFVIFEDEPEVVIGEVEPLDVSEIPQ